MTTPSEQGEVLAGLIAEELQGLDETGRRILCNRILAVVQPEGPPPPSAPALPPFTEAEARNYRCGYLGFGQYADTLIAQVPLDYLQWLADTSRTTWQNLHRYLQSDLMQRRQDADQ